MSAANIDRKAAFLKIITPYLTRIFENAPDFGSAGLTIVFHEGIITRIDISETVQRRVAPRQYGG
ncbi:MAG: hypothetical protein ABFC86_08960 [Rectinema sp.]|jgi:hypothetical protein